MAQLPAGAEWLDQCAGMNQNSTCLFLDFGYYEQHMNEITETLIADLRNVVENDYAEQLLPTKNLLRGLTQYIANTLVIAPADISISYEAVHSPNECEWVWCVRVTYLCKEGRRKPYSYTAQAFNIHLGDAVAEVCRRVVIDETRITKG